MSADQNTIHLTGRVVRDAEIRETKSGEQIANVSIAVNGYKRDDEATFFTLTLFAKKAAVAQYLKKGTRVACNGRLKQRKYPKKDGTEGVSLEVAVNDLTLLDSKRDTNDGPLIERKRGARPGSDWTSDAANDTDDIPF